MRKLFITIIAAVLLLCAACTPAQEATQAPSQQASATAGATATAEPTATPMPAWEGKYANVNGKQAEITIDDGAVKDAQAQLLTVSVAESATFTLAQPVNEEFNYYSFTFSSTNPLWLYFIYTVDGQPKEELCFLEAGEEQHTFNSFVDRYMDKQSENGFTGFRIENRGTEAANISISAITTVKRDYIEKDIYLQNTCIKIGADLVYGGGLSYLTYIKEPVALVTRDGRAEVGIGYADLAEATEVLSTDVNLLNNYDTGRLVQQSYYGTFSSPYVCGTWGGRSWCYNPVMGGDSHNNNSKIVDFELTDDHIYVKCRPQDWAKDNEPTLSYMESTYTIKDCELTVKNRFVDFSGYKHVQANQELPALYVIEPLYRLTYYKGSKKWVDEPLTSVDDLPFWDGVWPNFVSKENWWAWVNDAEDGFGIGLYVPTVTTVTGGIFSHDKNVGSDPSKASPTSYIAPLRQMTLVSYKPLEYTYVLACGRVSEMRAGFKALYESEAIDNTSLRKYNSKSN